jgi:hypothetical protein
MTNLPFLISTTVIAAEGLFDPAVFESNKIHKPAGDVIVSPFFNLKTLSGVRKPILYRLESKNLFGAFKQQSERAPTSQSRLGAEYRK